MILVHDQQNPLTTWERERDMERDIERDIARERKGGVMSKSESVREESEKQKRYWFNDEKNTQYTKLLLTR